HAHLVAGHPVHAAGGQAGATEDVAAADHQGDLGTGLAGLHHLAGDAPDHHRVDAVVLRPHQRLSRKFQQHATVDEIGHGGASGVGWTNAGILAETPAPAPAHPHCPCWPTWLRPRRLARYRAWSAAWSMARASANGLSWPSRLATPAEKVTYSGWPSTTAIGVRAVSSRIRRSTRAAAASLEWASTTRNSSPP